MISLLSLLIPVSVNAADVPVGYTVEDKPLKAASIGANLTFQLYSDAACSALVHSAVVPIEDVSLLVRLKQLTPKNDVKLPKTAELRTTLSGVAVPGPYYLKVTDANATVVAVNGDCQVQAAGAGGAAVLPRTVFVPADGTPAENGAALIAAANAITGDLDRPTTLQLDDGEYNIGSTTLALSGIVLAGRSAEHTLITAGGHATLSDTEGGAVRTDSNVRDVTIAVNGGGNTYGAGIVFVGFGTIANTTVTVSNAANSSGVWNVFGEVTLRNSKITTDASGPSVGVRNDWLAFAAQTRVLDSNIIASSSNVGDGDALVSDGGIVRVSGGTLEGNARYARANAGSASFRIRLAGLSGGTSGNVSCIGTTTATNTYSNTCPTESWATSFD